jgi:hypothetical protein
MKGSQLTKGVAALATKMRSENISWSTIAQYLHVSIDKLRYQLDPEYGNLKASDRYHANKSAEALPELMPKPPLLHRDAYLDKLRAGLGHDYAK